MTQRYEAQMKLFDSKLPVCSEVPVRPKAGYKYIFSWEKKEKRQDWRVDGYRWRQYSTVKFNYDGVDCKRYYFKLQIGPGNDYTTDFTRHAIESPSYDKKVLVWYQGDESVIVDSAHSHAKSLDNKQDPEGTQRYEAQMKLFDSESNLPMHSEVPIRPKGGFKYIFKWEDALKRQDWRVDGYRWRQNSTIRFTYGGTDCKRYYFKLQVGPGDEFTTEFTKHAIECPLFENKVLVWYQGDESVVVDFAHGNSKDPDKEFHRTAPSVLTKMKMETDKLPLQLYSDLVTAAPRELERHIIDAPRDIKQVQNARKLARKAERSFNATLTDTTTNTPAKTPTNTPASAKQVRKDPKQVQTARKFTRHKTDRSPLDAIYNVYSMHAETGFVSDIHFFPSLVVICFSESTMAEFKQLLDRDDLPPLCLSYETSFEVGELCLSVLSYRETEFEETPLVPLMFMIYEREATSVHDSFFIRFADAVPEFKTSQKMLIISEEEAAVVNAIEQNCPGVPRFRCWRHALRDIKMKLQLLDIEDIEQYENDFIRLINQDSPGQYKSILAQLYLKKWKKEFSEYFDMAIDPDMNKMSAWALQPYGVAVGTTNESETFIYIMQQFGVWEKSSVDLMVTSLMEIAEFFNVSVSVSRYCVGDYTYTLKEDLVDFYATNGEDIPEPFSVEELVSRIRSRTESPRKAKKRNSAATDQSKTSGGNKQSGAKRRILDVDSAKEAENSTTFIVEQVFVVDENELQEDTVYICQ